MISLIYLFRPIGFKLYVDHHYNIVAMLYQTVWMAYYDSKNLIQWPFGKFVKQCFVDFLSLAIILLGTNLMSLHSDSYFEWFVCAIKVALFVAIVVAAINEIFYRDKMNRFIEKTLKKVKLNGK